ncbi:hypothetical protein [Paraburkholderia unamae]|uniref:hypothetical protein n=1 Tax=Paraburkholderia unamae TaxID=219649 RepID=UPI000E3098AB|nr:hypothetical protein [Paraburkholderia unamae]CAG9271043.1 hypothetical protein PUN4_630065 [Paraburkholderia unamae]
MLADFTKESELILNHPACGAPARDPLEVCQPPGIEIYRLDAALLEGWSPPRVAASRWLHGMTLQPPDCNAAADMRRQARAGPKTPSGHAPT